MAEKKEIKKRAPKKPKTSEEVTDKVKEEVVESETPVSSSVSETSEEVVTTGVEDIPAEIPIVGLGDGDEGTKLPEDVTPFESVLTPEDEEQKVDSDVPVPAGAAKIRKLNPNLEDGQSKWLAIVISKKGQTHKLFKGSYAKAYNAAENYNVRCGFGKGVVVKIRK